MDMLFRSHAWCKVTDPRCSPLPPIFLRNPLKRNEIFVSPSKRRFVRVKTSFIRLKNVLLILVQHFEVKVTMTPKPTVKKIPPFPIKLYFFADREEFDYFLHWLGVMNTAHEDYYELVKLCLTRLARPCRIKIHNRVYRCCFEGAFYSNNCLNFASNEWSNMFGQFH